jgi:DNA-directed RNA polymerase subunit H (RpoH/RPB5)
VVVGVHVHHDPIGEYDSGILQQVSLTSAGLPSIAANNTVAIAKYNAAGQLIQVYPQHNAANIAQVIGSLVNETFVPTGHYSIPQA